MSSAILNMQVPIRGSRRGSAAGIIRRRDQRRVELRAAHLRTGIAAADFSRMRSANLGRFTVDRLMSTINRLGARVEVKVKVRAIEAAVA